MPSLIRRCHLAWWLIAGATINFCHAPGAAQEPSTSASTAPLSSDAPSKHSGKLQPTDFAKIRGANYRGVSAADTTDYWRHYDPVETERDLGYSDKLKLNQLRVFVNYAAFAYDKAAFHKNLGDLARLQSAQPRIDGGDRQL